jgi:hypothetical protein
MVGTNRTKAVNNVSWRRATDPTTLPIRSRASSSTCAHATLSRPSGNFSAQKRSSCNCRHSSHPRAWPTVLPNGKRIPGLKLDHPRQLALMHALVRFAHIAAGNTCTTAEIYPHTLAALEVTPQQYSLASLRHDLSKLRAKGLVAKVAESRRCRPKDTRSVWCFSNCLNASTRP